MKGLRFHSEDGWRGLVADETWSALFAQLDEWLAEHPGRLVVHYASREVRRVETPQGVVYAKLIRGLTDAGFAHEEWFSWFKWVFRPSRALATWHISQTLLSAGFACPVPILAARRRHRGYPTDLFISMEVPRPNLWDAPGEPAELIQLLAEETARFHLAGFAHGDFILRNLCSNPVTRHLVYLDNDRTWRPIPGLRSYYQRRNLAQLTYSLLRRFGRIEVPRAFLAEYRDLNPALSENSAARILKGAEKRLANRGKRRAAPSAK